MAGTQAEIEAEMIFNGGDERAATALVKQNPVEETNKDKEEAA